MKEVEDHPIEDVYGNEICSGDTYFVFGNSIVGDIVVHDKNLKYYLINVYEIKCFKAAD